MNSLKNRGVQDILILCSDGLSGDQRGDHNCLPGDGEQQRRIVHMVRNTLKYVANKDMKEFAKDLKTVYTAVDEEAALERTRKSERKMVAAVSVCHETLV